jgi:type IV secretory pathway VirB6-like protein
VSNWTLFTGLLAVIQGPLDAAVVGISDALLAHLSVLLPAGMVVTIGFQCLLSAWAPEGSPFSGIGRQVITAGLLWAFFMTAASYSDIVRGFLQHGLPDELSAAITGASGAAAVGAGVFDVLWGNAWALGMKVYADIPFWSPSGLGLSIAVMAYLLISILAIGVGFLIWLIALVMLDLLIAAGPVFVFVVIFPFFASIFHRWISALLSMVVLKVLVVTLLAITITGENQIMDTLKTSQAAAVGIAVNGSHEMQELGMLFGSMMIFVIVAALASQLPHMSQALVGGVHFHVQSAIRGFSDAATSLAGQAGSMGTRGMDAVLEAVGLRGAPSAGGSMAPSQASGSAIPFVPPGRSISGTP